MPQPPELSRASAPAMRAPPYFPARQPAPHPEPHDGEPMTCASIDRMAARALQMIDDIFPEVPHVV